MERLLGIYKERDSTWNIKNIWSLGTDRTVNLFVGRRGQDRGVTGISWKERGLIWSKDTRVLGLRN